MVWAQGGHHGVVAVLLITHFTMGLAEAATNWVAHETSLAATVGHSDAVEAARQLPSKCSCQEIDLGTLPYSPGGLQICEGRPVNVATDKNCCPPGWKIFSPRNSDDWETVFRLNLHERAKDGNLFLVDVTKGFDGFSPFGEGTTAAISSDTNSARGMADGTSWYLQPRDSVFRPFTDDYSKTCYLNVARISPGSRAAKTLAVVEFQANANKCAAKSNKYLCQPRQAFTARGLTFNGDRDFPVERAAVYAQGFSVVIQVRYSQKQPQQSVFDFGKTSEAHVHLTMLSCTDTLRLSLQNGGSGVEIDTKLPPVNTSTIAVVTVGNGQACLYTEAVFWGCSAPAGACKNTSITPLDFTNRIDDMKVWLGRSLVDGVSPFNGTIEYIKVSANPLTFEAALDEWTSLKKALLRQAASIVYSAIPNPMADCPGTVAATDATSCNSVSVVNPVLNRRRFSSMKLSVAGSSSVSLLSGSQAWRPATSDTKQWLVLDLGAAQLLRGVVVQGDGQDDWWVTKFELQFSTDNITWMNFSRFSPSDGTFQGPNNREGVFQEHCGCLCYLLG